MTTLDSNNNTVVPAQLAFRTLPETRTSDSEEGRDGGGAAALD